MEAADGVSKEKTKKYGANVYRVCNGQLWDLVWHDSYADGAGDFKKTNERKISDRNFKLKYKKIIGDEAFICYCMAVYHCGSWPENSGFSLVLNNQTGAFGDYSYKTGQKVAAAQTWNNPEAGSTIWKGEKTFRLSDIKFYQAVENLRAKERQQAQSRMDEK